VPEVQTGEGVVLQGMNFSSVDATVRLAAQPPGTATREVDAHVVGDIDTPLDELVDGNKQRIRDCRVHDRLTFRVPDDLPPGIYAFQVAVPNISGFPALSDPVLSNPQYIRVIPPTTARFEIHSETLTAREETSPAFFGSDEVRIRVLAYPITAGLTNLILGDEQRFDSDEFGDMDSGDVRDMKALLFGHQEPIDGVVMAIWGFEIDSEKAYTDQINTFTDAFLHYLKIAGAAIATAFAAGAIAIGLKDLFLLGLAHPIILGIAIALTAAVLVFLANWAPADPIIVDTIGFTTVDLAALTSAEFPLPEVSEYPTQNDITVRVFPLEKIPTQYRERREYISAEEESRYEIVLRYNRVA
jgi:hypothetical protein